MWVNNNVEKRVSRALGFQAFVPSNLLIVGVNLWFDKLELSSLGFNLGGASAFYLMVRVKEHYGYN